MKKPFVFIIILNYKSFNDTINCINSLKDINYNNYSLLVIDNNSQDGSCKKLKEVLNEDEFVSLKKNIGYAGGNNYGIEVALKRNADYVLILNPDIIISKESLCEYINIMQNNQKIAALNPIQLSSKDGPLDKRFMSSVLNGFNEKEIITAINSDQLIEVDNLFGASIILPRSTILKVGGFDPLYFAYFEEKDLCRRIKYFNMKLYVTLKSPVIHLRNYSDPSINNFREYLRLKGRYLYILKEQNSKFIINLKYFYYNLRSDFLFMKKNKKSKAQLRNYLKMLVWIFFNMPRIYYSRKNEKKGISHIKIIG